MMNEAMKIRSEKAKNKTRKKATKNELANARARIDQYSRCIFDSHVVLHAYREDAGIIRSKAVQEAMLATDRKLYCLSGVASPYVSHRACFRA
jgi:hypothetical protein